MAHNERNTFDKSSPYGNTITAENGQLVADTTAAAVTAGASTTNPYVIERYPGAKRECVEQSGVGVLSLEDLVAGDAHNGLMTSHPLLRRTMPRRIVTAGAAVAIVVDDGQKSTYFPLGSHADYGNRTFAEMMSDNGIPVSLALQADMVGGANALTALDLTMLRGYGWCIGGHGYTDGTGLDLDEGCSDVARAYRTISDLSYTSYPASATYKQTHRICGSPQFWAMPGSWGATEITAHVKNTGGYPVASTSIHLEDLTRALIVGDYLYAQGHTHVVTAVGGLSGDEQTVSISPALWGQGTLADAAEVLVYYGTSTASPVAKQGQLSRVLQSLFPAIRTHTARAKWSAWDCGSGMGICGQVMPADAAAATALVSLIANSGCCVCIFLHNPGVQAGETRAAMAQLAADLATAVGAGTIECLTLPELANCQIVNTNATGIPDSGFEANQTITSGSTSTPPTSGGWWAVWSGAGSSVAVSNGDAHAGTYSCLLTKGATGSVILRRAITLNPQGTYRLKFWTKSAAENTANVDVMAYGAYGNQMLYPDSTFTKISRKPVLAASSGWTQHCVTFGVPPDIDEAWLEWTLDTASRGVYVDDVTLQPC
jgi:hypothetical protein